MGHDTHRLPAAMTIQRQGGRSPAHAARVAQFIVNVRNMCYGSPSSEWQVCGDCEHGREQTRRAGDLRRRRIFLTPIARNPLKSPDSKK